MNQTGLVGEVERLQHENDRLDFSQVVVNAYFASVLADLIRRKLFTNRVSFTFETVMSSPDKIDLLREARIAGFRTYLYYVATEDPNINIARVQYRVKSGGHDVPESKIVSRYHRSLDLLYDAIRCTHRAYVFDNSGDHLRGCPKINIRRAKDL